MDGRFGLRHAAGLTVLVAAMVSIAGRVLAQRACRPGEDVYNCIKANEPAFQPPRPYAAVRVGTFDAATGEYTRHFTGEVAWEVLPTGGRGPVRVMPERRSWRAIEVNAVDVGLIFELRNPQGKVFEVTVDVVEYRITGAPAPWLELNRLDQLQGSAPSIAATGNVVTVNARDAHVVTWTVRSGSRSWGDTAFISRPRVVGVGAFTVPALPIAVIYAPPVNADCRPEDRGTEHCTKAIYARESLAGTTTRLSFSEENSSTRPTAATFASAGGVASAIRSAGGAASGLGGLGVPYASEVGQALDFVAGGLDAFGTSTATTQSATSVTRDSALAVSEGWTQQWETDGRVGGPGHGDVVVFLQDVRLVWLAYGGRLTLAYLGHRALQNPSVRTLKSLLVTGDRVTGLRREAIEALISLDPLADVQLRIDRSGRVIGRPLGPPRFDWVDCRVVTESSPPERFRRAISEQTERATTEITTRMEDYRAGFLSFFTTPWSVTRTETLATTISQRTATQHTQQKEITVGVDWRARPGERYAVEVWYDRVFGTFAFWQPPPGPVLLSGTVLDAKNRPAAGKLVTVTSGGKSSSTYTGSDGRYAFQGCPVASGRGVVKVGDETRSFDFRGSPLPDLELRIKP